MAMYKCNITVKVNAISYLVTNLFLHRESSNLLIEVLSFPQCLDEVSWFVRAAGDVL